MEDSQCDGTVESVIINKYCMIPMATFTQEPYSLEQGTLIQVTVQGLNQVGWSTTSSLNTVGVKVQTEPKEIPTAPIVDTFNSNELQITILIAPIEEIELVGGSAITSYSLEWD